GRQRRSRPAPRRAASRALGGRDLKPAIEALVAVLRLRVVDRLDGGMQTGPLRHALAAEVAPAGQEVLAGGDVQRAAVGELDHLLEDALAERLLPHEVRAMAILHRARDDLRRRRRPAV